MRTALLALALWLGAWDGLLLVLDFLSHFAAHLVVLLTLSAAALALRRRWRRAVFALLAAATLAAGPLGAALAPAARPGEGVALRIVFANLDSNNPHPAAAAAALARLDADVLALAEAPMSLREGALAGRYPHRVERLRWVYSGVWIWSKLKVLDGWKQDNTATDPAAAWGRLALPSGGAFDLLALQLRRPLLEQQATQLATLTRAPPALIAPRVVLGDFNAAPWSLAMRRIAASTGTQLVGGLRWSWRSDLAAWLGPLAPLASLPLDHALISEEVGVRAARLVTLPGSDHDALVLDLTLPRRPLAPDAPTPHGPVAIWPA